MKSNLSTEEFHPNPSSVWIRNGSFIVFQFCFQTYCFFMSGVPLGFMEQSIPSEEISESFQLQKFADT